ncbi:MAG: stage III sporulation protein AB [Oscillospiraceae bacterium]|nr:stage III sporulation protein AB [Oscillospiraceae bacterium]
MTIKLFGAILIVLSSWGIGLTIVTAHRKKVSSLNDLLTAIRYMKSELRYRCTPLPALCKASAGASHGYISGFLQLLSDELEAQVCPDTKLCAIQALTHIKEIPNPTAAMIMTLADTLGMFDLSGQLDGLDMLETQIEQALHQLTQQQDVRLRSYQTLSLCAGAALVILLI